MAQYKTTGDRNAIYGSRADKPLYNWQPTPAQMATINMLVMHGAGLDQAIADVKKWEQEDADGDEECLASRG